jgi:basic amino acid/polyamine antiporter, APA family
MSSAPHSLQGKPTPAGEHHALLRTMGFWALTVYGVGDMLGTGIYALIGKAAGVMGNAVWMAFAGSMLAAMFTGLSYACLGSRYPRSAGAAYIAQRAFGRPMLSYMVGLAVAASGLTSMATASRAFAGYILELTGIAPLPLLIVGFIVFLTAVNLRGMRESTFVNLVCTVIEAGGLVFIVIVGLRWWGSVNYLQLPPREDTAPISLALQGAVLTFYAFIGFEDLLNVSEEVKDVERTLPRALVLALLIVAGLYAAVSITAISVVPHAELAQSSGPLVEVVRRAAPWCPPALFTGVCLFAIANTSLLNYIMGSRLIYGMARQGLLPAVLGRLHPSRRTPYVAILCLMVVVMALALVGDISGLAKATAVLLLGVFTILNTALVLLKNRPGEPRGTFEVPVVIPLGGIVICILLLAHAQRQELTLAGVLLLLILVHYALTRQTRQADIRT